MFRPVAGSPRRNTRNSPLGIPKFYEYDVSRIAGLVLHIDMSTPVGYTASGTDITALTDLTPSSTKAFASSGAAHGQLVTLSNFRKVLRLNGTNNYYLGNAATQALLDGVSNATIIVVQRGDPTNASADILFRAYTGTTQYTVRVIAIDAADTNFDGVRIQFQSTDTPYTERTAAHTSKYRVPFNELAINSAKYTAADGVVVGWTAGTANNVSGNGPDGQSLRNDADAICTIGGSTAGFNLFKGDIAEIIVVAAALSDAEIALVERHLANKWRCFHPDADWVSRKSALHELRIQQGELAEDSAVLNPRNITVGTDYSTVLLANPNAFAGDTIQLPTGTEMLTKDLILRNSGLSRRYPLAFKGNGTSNSIIDGAETALAGYQTILSANYIDLRKIMFQKSFGNGVLGESDSALKLGPGIDDGGTSILIRECGTNDSGSNGIYTSGGSRIMITGGDYSDPDTEPDHGGWHPIYVNGGENVTVKELESHDADSGVGLRIMGSKIDVRNVTLGETGANARELSLFADPGYDLDQILLQDITSGGTDSTVGGYSGDDGTSLIIYGGGISGASGDSENAGNILVANWKFNPGANTVRNIKTQGTLEPGTSLQIGPAGYENTVTGSAQNADSIGMAESSAGMSIDAMLHIGQGNADHFNTYHPHANWIKKLSAADQAIVHANRYDREDFLAL